MRLVLVNGLVHCLHKVAVKCVNSLQFSKAEIAYKFILQLDPTNRLANFQLVELYKELSRLDCATQVLEDWLKLFSDDIQARTIIAQLYVEQEETTKSKAHLEFASDLAPNSPDVLFTFGLFHRRNDNLEESSSFFRSALKQCETSAILFHLAENQIDQGARDKATGLLERAIELSPDFHQAYHLLASMRYFREPSHPYIAFIENRLDKGSLPPSVRLGFHFALGEAFDNLRLYDEAFGHFKAGNDLIKRKLSFSVEEITKYVDLEVQTFDQGYFRAREVSAPSILGESLIFVLGMPRSGTTLVEQILASHPDVCAGGERRDIQEIARQVSADLSEPYPLCIGKLSPDAISKIARHHLSRVSHNTRGASHFVDKQLFNFLKVGLIATIFPGAKLVHCQRNPLDACVSCFCKNFQDLPYTTDLETLGLFYKQYASLMSHWHSVLPGRILDLQYEYLVNEPEGQIRRLLSYCDLSWHTGCLSPHRTNRVVHTASAVQVKSPINCQSIGRWKHYEKHLQPLIDALGTLADESQYRKD